MNVPDRPQKPDGGLQQALQPVSLSPAQRARHRHLLASTYAGQRAETTRARGKFELAVVALALICVITTALLWGALGDGAQEDAEAEALQATRIAQERATAAALSTSVMAALPVFDAGACAATPFANSLPAGVPRQDPAFSDWYGSPSGGLWAAPVDRSVHRQGPIKAETHWFAGEATYVLWYGSLEPLQIKGTRVDGDGSFASGGATKINAVMATQWTAFEIPTPGCWSISATAGTATLNIVVSVAPLAYRPDILYLERVTAATPYEPPAACNRSPVIGPETTRAWYVAAFAAQEGDMLMSINQAWLTAGRAESLHFMGAALSEDARISARQDGARLAFATRTVSSGGLFGDMTFPSPGCWEIDVETPGETTTFTVYVYPTGCAPAESDLRIPSECHQPGR